MQLGIVFLFAGSTTPSSSRICAILYCLGRPTVRKQLAPRLSCRRDSWKIFITCAGTCEDRMNSEGASRRTARGSARDTYPYINFQAFMWQFVKSYLHLLHFFVHVPADTMLSFLCTCEVAGGPVTAGILVPAGHGTATSPSGCSSPIGRLSRFGQSVLLCSRSRGNQPSRSAAPHPYGFRH